MAVPAGGEEAHVAELSRRMLQGWRLLSDTCPRTECDVPLVQPPGGGGRLCVRCGEEYGTDDLVPVPRLPPASASGGQGGDLGAPAAPDGDSTEDLDDVRSDSARFGPFAVGPVASPAGPDVTGAEVKPGPVEEVEGGPLGPASPHLRSPGQPRPITPVFDAVDAEPAPPPPSAPSPGKERRRRSDEASRRIAEFLLQGWALLDDYCPMAGCNCPLVRNRESKRRCVSCDMWVMAPGQAPPPPPVLEKAESPAVGSPTPLSSPGTGEQQMTQAETTIGSGESFPPEWPGTRGANFGGSGHTPIDHVTAPTPLGLQSTIDILIERIGRAEDALRPPVLAPAVAREWVALITDCANAIKALDDVQRISLGPR